MDRTNPVDKHLEIMINRYGMVAAPVAPQMFGNAGREHMEKYGTNYVCVKHHDCLNELKYESCGCVVLQSCVQYVNNCVNVLKAQNQNTLLKLPGRTTSIPPGTRKKLYKFGKT